MQNLNKIIFRLSLVACISCFSGLVLAESSEDKEELVELNKANEQSQNELSQVKEEATLGPQVLVPVYGPLSQVSQAFAGTLSDLAGRFYTDYPNTLARVMSYGMQAMIVNANSEIGGRIFRAFEFGGSLDRISFIPAFMAGMCSACLLPSTASPQQIAMVSTAPIEQSRVFTFSRMERWLRTGDSMTPSTAFAVALTTTSQLSSVYLTGDRDIRTYVNNMNAAYGSNTITEGQIKAVAWLELLNPLIYTSIYSSVMNEDAKVRVFDINGFKVVPSIQVILTPYGAIEKRLVTYMPRDSKTFNFSFGFGRDALGRQTYYIEGGSDNVLYVSGIKIGLKTMAWRQPNLFDPDPSTSQMKLGILTQIIADYQLIPEYLNIHTTFTWKTSGFVQGHAIKRSFTALVATEFQL